MSVVVRIVALHFPSVHPPGTTVNITSLVHMAMVLERNRRRERSCQGRDVFGSKGGVGKCRSSWSMYKALSSSPGVHSPPRRRR